jgi:hypothetical protein
MIRPVAGLWRSLVSGMSERLLDVGLFTPCR